MFQFLPHSLLQMGTIFLSIIIEALPFVMLGCIISGALYVFLTPDRVKKILPKHKILSIFVGSLLGFFFPSCECGIVPIIHQFVKKDVPSYTAFAFMVTAPIINPIVLFSTYLAFGNSLKFVVLRVLGSLLVALVVGVWLAYINQQEILQPTALNDCGMEVTEHNHEKESFWHKCWEVLTHGITEFFDTGRYLIFGSLIAAGMQTYLPTSMIVQFGQTKILAILVMLVLAASLSLCSEADAFIGSSLVSLFGAAPVVGFLVFGPMVDSKNLLLMHRYFKTSFVLKFVGLITVVVSLYALAL